jgi:hypothetical protein
LDLVVVELALLWLVVLDLIFWFLVEIVIMKIPLIVGMSLLHQEILWLLRMGWDPLWKDSSAAAVAAADQVVTVVTPLAVAVAV